jgi:hypothetical protein
MMRKSILAVGALCFLLFLHCSNSATNPYTPNNANIVKQNSLQSLTAKHDSLVAGVAVQCTVGLNLPSQIDSFYLHLIPVGGADSIIRKGAVSSVDSAISFTLTVNSTGTYTLRFLIVRKDKTTDSLVKTIIVYSPTSPQLALFVTANDSLIVHKDYPCTLKVILPELVDSFYLSLTPAGGADSILKKEIMTAADSVIYLHLAVNATGAYSLHAGLINKDKTKITVNRNITVYPSPVPQLSWILPLKDSLIIRKEYTCSLAVTHPEQADSFFVRRIIGTTDTLLASGKASGSLTFKVAIPTVGTFSLRVLITTLSAAKDSLTRNFTGYALVPVVIPDSSSRHIYLPADSFTFSFTVTDPDSNVRFGYTWLDTATAATQSTPFMSLKPFHESFTRTVKKDALLAGLHTPIVCKANALDADSQFSQTAVCTLFVLDTTSPAITLLSPANVNDTIKNLPVVIKAVASDLAGIGSGAFNGTVMLLKRDTVSFKDTLIDTVSSLDTGKHTDSIVVLDNSGNKGHLLLSLIYQGKQLYRPEIKELSRATTEGHAFASIWLDTCVTIKDPGVTDKLKFAKDSLSWEIRDSTGKLLAYDLNTHLFTVPFPSDTEWAGTIKLTFKVWVTANPTLSDTKQPLFLAAEVWDPPVITLPNQSVCGADSTPFDIIYLDTITTVRAPDNALSSLSWTFKNGSHFGARQISKKICKLGGICGIIITRYVSVYPLLLADSKWTGTDTLTFTVTDPGHPEQPTIKSLVFTRSKLCFIIRPPLEPIQPVVPVLPKRGSQQ